MPKFMDLTGQRFARLAVLRRVAGGDGQTRFACRCDCGRVAVVRAANLRRGLTRSCGCLSVELAKQRIAGGITHKNCDGRSRLPEYRVWHGVRQRCYNSRMKYFPYYGGRGIKICERWQSFDNFLADMGPRPTAKHTLDRINNDGDYSPDNCRWATRTDQQNNRRANVIVSYCGEQMTMAEAIARSGLPSRLVRSRRERGITGDALFAPKMERGWVVAVRNRLAKTHCKHGHPFSEYSGRTARQRRCLKCHALREAARRSAALKPRWAGLC